MVKVGMRVMVRVGMGERSDESGGESKAGDIWMRLGCRLRSTLRKKTPNEVFKVHFRLWIFSSADLST